MSSVDIRGSGSGKTKALLKLINYEPDIDKIYLYAKDPYEAKYKLLIKKRESAGLKYLNDSKAFIEYLDDMDDTSKNIKEYNPNKKPKILFLMIWLLICLVIKKLIPIMAEWFIREKKLDISLVFIAESYFPVLKNIRLKSAHYFVMKTPIKRELQETTFNHSPDIDFQYFMHFYKKSTAEQYSVLIIDTLFPSDNSLRFRMNLLEII